MLGSGKGVASTLQHCTKFTSCFTFLFQRHYNGDSVVSFSVVRPAVRYVVAGNFFILLTFLCDTISLYFWVHGRKGPQRREREGPGAD